MINFDKLKEEFWHSWRVVKSTNNYELLRSHVDFCQNKLSKLTNEQLLTMFGKYTEFVKKNINASVKINLRDKHYYLKLGIAN